MQCRYWLHFLMCVPNVGRAYNQRVPASKSNGSARIHPKGDERILGESDFVKMMLADQ